MAREYDQEKAMENLECKPQQTKKTLMNVRDENLQTDTNSAINYDRMLSPVVLESIQNDAQIKALNQMMNDLYKYSSPKYVMQTNGEINAVNSKEFDDAVEKIAEQIELRQQQIVSAYNWHNGI
jgi:hypothetical protein